MSDSDLQHLRARLKPLCIPGGRDTAPACYRTTGALEETPHVWIRDPRKSIVLTLKADVRLVPSNSFATPYSLRFPRVTSIGWDKSWADIFKDSDLEQLVSQGAGKLSVYFGKGGGGRGGRGGARGGAGAGRGAQHIRSGIRGVAPGLAAPSLAGVAVESAIFAGESICVLPAPAAGEDAREKLQALVKRHGGRLTQEIISSENSRDRTTRVVAARFDPVRIPKQAEAAASSTLDVLTPGWLRDCVAAGEIIPPAPRHRWRFALGSQLHADGKVDNFGDRCALSLLRMILCALASSL
jgi:DNA ligase-4